MLHARTLESEHRLAEVIGQMARAAQQDGEAIARSVFGEIFFRYGTVPLEPVGPRHFFKPVPQFSIDGVPCLANLFVRRNGGLRLVGIGDEGNIKLGMKPISQPQQRQHRVVYGCEMSPQVKQPVPARGYFPQDLLGREASKKLVRPLDLRLPHLQRESHIRSFVCHSSVSSHLYISFVYWETLSEHGSATFRLLFCGLILNDVPMLDKDSVLNAHNICGNPIHRSTETAKSPVHDHDVSLSHDRSRFVLQRWWD